MIKEIYSLNFRLKNNILPLLIFIFFLILIMPYIYFTIIGFLFFLLSILFIKKPEIPLAIQFTGTIIYFYIIFKLNMETTSILTGSFHSFLVYCYLLGGIIFSSKYVKKIKVSWIDVLFGIFFFIIFLSYLVLSHSSKKILYAPLWVIAPYIGIQLLQVEKKLFSFIKCCIVVATIQAIFSFYELFLNPVFTKTTRFSMYRFSRPGQVDNPILYAMTFAILIIILIMQIYEGKNKIKLKYFILLIPSFYLLLRSGSRGVLISTFIVILFYFSVIVNTNINKKILSIFFILLFFATSYMCLPGVTRSFYTSTINSIDTPGTSINIRINLIKESLNDFRRSPIWGIGTGNSAAGYGSPHNMILEIFTEWGIIGFFIFLLLYYITIKTALIFIKSEKNPDLIFLMKLSLTLFIFFTIQGVLFGGYITTYTQFFLSMGLISSIGKLKEKPICIKKF